MTHLLFRRDEFPVSRWAVSLVDGSQVWLEAQKVVFPPPSTALARQGHHGVVTTISFWGITGEDAETLTLLREWPATQVLRAQHCGVVEEPDLVPV